MAQRDNILQELNELQSSLANTGVQNTYRVPEGYFEGLTELVLGRIRALEAGNSVDELSHLSPLLSSISKKMPYSVPAGFFNDLEEKVKEITNNSADLSPAEELEELSPLLSGLKKEMPYSVPAGYFEELNKREVVPVNQPAAKVISITRQPWFRYAAAAIVTGVVVLAGFLIFSRSNSVDPAKESSKWVEVNLKKVNTDDIDKFVQLADEGAPVIAMTDVRDAIQEINEIKELMKDVPEKDLQNFLDETETLADEPAGDEDVLMN